MPQCSRCRVVVDDSDATDWRQWDVVEYLPRPERLSTTDALHQILAATTVEQCHELARRAFEVEGPRPTVKHEPYRACLDCTKALYREWRAQELAEDDVDCT